MEAPITFRKAAARNGIYPFGRAFGKFAVQGFLERGAAGEFFEAAPVFRASVRLRGFVQPRAHRFQIQLALLAGANVFALGGFVLLFHSFAPSGLFSSSCSNPRLAPWAAFFRRFAAGQFRFWVAQSFSAAIHTPHNQRL
jgi:hypothetical protein